ncbi:MAG: GntR family transcriptional regulator [Paracoccus sp. (in: a-proteobacteria)]|nr:GntR family transcriptional regulator [Paracoccus sp. (in: a-proteobacteria)]
MSDLRAAEAPLAGDDPPRAAALDGARGDDASIALELASQLRREILRGVFPPGAIIKERMNAERLGVSRTPMREAVRVLAQEGLVQLRPLRSAVVADPSITEVRHEIAVLRALELLAADLAVENVTAADLARIAALEARIALDYETGDRLDVFDVDMEFHLAIVAASGNPALIRTHREYLARLWRLRFISARERRRGDRVLEDHEYMRRALQTRDAALLRARINRHLDGLVRNIEIYFAARSDTPPESAAG